MHGDRSLLLILAPALCFGVAFQSGNAQTQAAAASAAVSTPAEQVQPRRGVEPLTSENRGDIFMARKMYLDAIEEYKKMPETAVILNKTGIAYHQMLELRIAQRYYQKAIKLDPNYSEAVNNLGTIFYANKNYGRALRQYRKALKMTPNVASVYSNLGTAYFARKNYQEAMEAYQEALKLDPDVFEHRSAYGVLLQEQTVEERSRFHYYLAKLYAQSDKTDLALLYIRKALEEGFKERKKFLEEPEFAKLRDNATFKELMTQEPHVL
jgi:tetratricopeptide (TPR) repeat protein